MSGRAMTRRPTTRSALRDIGTRGKTSFIIRHSLLEKLPLRDAPLSHPSPLVWRNNTALNLTSSFMQ